VITLSRSEDTKRKEIKVTRYLIDRNFSDPTLRDIIREFLPQPRTDIGSYPKTATRKTDVGYVVEVLIPGVPKEDVLIHMDPSESTLTISYDGESVTRPFTKMWNIGTAINIEEVTATSKDGVLTVTLPFAKNEKEAITVEIV